MEHFADRLLAACERKGTPICVGIDPVWERLPRAVQRAAVLSGAEGTRGQAAQGLLEFCRGVLEAVAPIVPCVKLQSACFERYFAPGVAAYHALVEEAAAMGLIVIGDAKRGDIGVSAEHYAAGCLADAPQDEPGATRNPDALTVNAYLGEDGLAPFMSVAKEQGKGLFALVRTSNPGGDALQGLPLADGRTVAEAVADLVARWGSQAGCVGRRGYSLIGAVVGATKVRDAAALRERMPQQVFLVPGFGAQGGAAADVRACFKPDGAGAVITASRSVLYAYEKSGSDDWKGAVAEAATQMKREVARALG